LFSEIFNDFFYFRDREVIIVSEVFDQLNLIHVVFIIFGGVHTGFARFAQKSLTDVKMDGLLGNAGPLDQLANLHNDLGWDGAASEHNPILA
jgi:hypothetical protein